MSGDEPTRRAWALPTRARAWAWGVTVVALPALVSPLLFVPIPYALPRDVLGAIAAIAMYPRLFAGLATCLAILGAKRWADSWLQLVWVTCIVILAWICAGNTIDKIIYTF
jgi:hypothetical protein